MLAVVQRAVSVCVCVCVYVRLLIEMTVHKMHDHVALQCIHRFEYVNNGCILRFFVRH